MICPNNQIALSDDVRLNELLRLVFDKQQHIKPCGRDVCKELIQNLSDRDKNTDFGNMDTGKMNVGNILFFCKDMDYFQC